MTGKLLADWLQQRKLQVSHRQIVLISGELNWCLEQAGVVMQHADSRCLLISKSSIACNQLVAEHQASHIPASQYKQQLGKEFDIVVYNAFDGIKPSALYAVEGTVGKSGLLVVLCPAMRVWGAHAENSLGIAFNLFNKPTKSLFIERMRKLLHANPTVAHVNNSAILLPLDYANSPDLSAVYTDTNEKVAVNLSAAQQNALKKLMNNTANASIGLIMAKRGRGKSTLLGRLGVELKNKHPNLPIHITASHRNNCKRSQIEFENAFLLYSPVAHLVNEPDAAKETKADKLTFIAPDQLSSLPQRSILLIDEAAVLSPGILLNACRHFQHVVMATTTAGYEGSGLGFSLKVLPKLHDLNKSFVSVALEQAIRWLENDGLENAFAGIFAPFEHVTNNQSLLACYDLNNNVNAELIYFNIIDKACLVQSESLIAAIFSLLIQSHYQTSPDDLMRILDAPDHHIAVLSTSKSSSDELHEQNILAVAVIVHEGISNADCENELLADIVCAKRRINGHLVAQNLTNTMSDDWFITAKSWRIMRIAVQAPARSKGVGSILLENIRKLAVEHNVDFLSTSFGLSDDLLHFWHKQHFSLVKIGARIDTSSGEHSGIMIVSLRDEAKLTFCKYAGVLVNDAKYLQEHVLRRNNYANAEQYTALITEHLNVLINQNGSEGIKAHSEAVLMNTHQQRISQFIRGSRSFPNVAASIYFYASSSETLAALLRNMHEKHLPKENKLQLLTSLKTYLLKHICPPANT